MDENYPEKIHFVSRHLKEIVVALALALIAAIVIDAWRQKSDQEVLSSNRNAVALVHTYSSKGELVGTGSGFFIDDQGTLVTNFHVLEGADVVDVEMQNRAFYKPEKIVCANREDDLAVIKFNAVGTPSVKFGDSSKIESGERVYVIGSPLGLQDSVSDGVISNPHRKFDGHEFIQHTASISSGNSGGGLFNVYGRVVGVTSGSIMAEKPNVAENLNLAVPINLVKNCLNEGEKSLTEGSSAYYYSQGIFAENNHDFDSAETYLKKATELDNQFAEAYSELGGIYYEKGLYNQEVENYLKATQLAPNNYEFFYYLATAYEDEGSFSDAISAYQKALELKPDDKDSLRDLAILYIAIGQKNKAVALFPKLMNLDRGGGLELKLLLGL